MAEWFIFSQVLYAAITGTVNPPAVSLGFCASGLLACNGDAAEPSPHTSGAIKTLWRLSIRFDAAMRWRLNGSGWCSDFDLARFLMFAAIPLWVFRVMILLECIALGLIVCALIQGYRSKKESNSEQGNRPARKN